MHLRKVGSRALSSCAGEEVTTRSRGQPWDSARHERSSGHIHQRIRFARNSPCFLILSDDATALFICFATHSRRSMLLSKSAAIAVRLGACVSRCVSDRRWRAMDVEIKLHLQMGRSSSNPLMVVATADRCKNEV
ncbi:hypothetical protein CC86DRAFT_38152 [Ophiobolus disseminans]|uniref:Uncharacterized protein n=1 Tax=Ophiobolus disseminans TaxID=1469910 RepID=A0A6A6ZZT6_9PLEO|nr:hypothetical protein CC86DRAFT_38152 [Ophiobolus disseminans]